MALLPPPPVAAGDPTVLTVTSVDIAASIAAGVCGACVMCRAVTTRWWDLSACGMAPVTDGTGVLTDQLGLHPACAGAVVERWTSMVAGPDGDEPSADTGADVVDDLAGGDSAIRADRPADATPDDAPAPRRRGDRAALLGGVYSS